ncbi:hypothetical protein C2G38_2245621 [Gigaspora rosea]|uniref:BTB domain-containing protein n=1 Tax=Gigaspora rosea TaxID=44941 RepID=A0A397VAH6_9GLOM|nr:hypothetical protein C2G38_2245621 [Gigaspora rosea]
MTETHLKKLSTDYLELLDDKEDFNVIINTGEAPHTKIFRVHSNVLRYRSLYFRDKLATTIKDENNIKTINLKIFLFNNLKSLLRVILLENQDTTFIYELMLIASEFLLKELAKYIEIHLIETKANWLRLHFTLKYPNKIFESEDFTSIQENALVSLIKRDDLQMEEVKIWDYIIKWGIAQNPELSPDPKNWTNENFQALKNKLQNFLPLIRYFQISNDDIVDYIEPYQVILEKDLWKDILKRIANPNRQVSSTILPSRTIMTQTLPPHTKKSKKSKKSKPKNELDLLPFSNLDILPPSNLFDILPPRNLDILSPSKLLLLPPSKLNLDEWKRFYSNHNKRPDAINWFWDHYDSEGYSIWQRARKFAFGSLLVLGEDYKNEIAGYFVIRGREIPEEVSGAAGFESYEFKKVDHTDPKVRSNFENYLAWDGHLDGKKFANGKIFK